MMYNWKFIRTKKGKYFFAACDGDELIAEFNDFTYASLFETNREFYNSINEFGNEYKKFIEYKIKGQDYEMNIDIIPSEIFRKLQRDIKKEKEKKKKYGK